MTSACTHCSHCFTMFEWHAGSLNLATKGARLLSHQENIHCVPPRDPQMRSNPRCCSLELLSAEQFQAKSCCTHGQCAMHMDIGPRPSAQCDAGEKCRCCINTMRSGQSMQPYYLHFYGSIASLFTGKEMHFASEMHHEHRGAAV